MSGDAGGPRPASTVVLHVGVMKSGTTFVQGQLYANRDSLRRLGVKVPGASWAKQVDAVKDVLKGDGGGEPGGPWERMAGRVVGHAGRSVISMEFLGPVVPEKIQRVVASLRPARVEVVITARDLNRSILALWQETIQNGRWWTLPEYVAGVHAGRPGTDPARLDEAGRTFWRQQDLVRICRDWAAEADRVTVVTVPPPGAGRTLLLDRFAEAAGLPGLELRPTVGNESIGAASTLALRAMNELLAERGMPFPEGVRVRKALLAKKVLAPRRAEEPSFGLPVADWVVESAAALVDGLRGLDVDLVGDWADLDPVAVPGVGPEDIRTEEVTEAAVAGLAGLVRTRAARKRRKGPAKGPGKGPGRGPGEGRPGGGRAGNGG